MDDMRYGVGRCLRRQYSFRTPGSRPVRLRASTRRGTTGTLLQGLGEKRSGLPLGGTDQSLSGEADREKVTFYRIIKKRRSDRSICLAIFVQGFLSSQANIVSKSIVKF